MPMQYIDICNNDGIYYICHYYCKYQAWTIDGLHFVISEYFQTLEVVNRVSETKLQVRENSPIK